MTNDISVSHRLRATRHVRRHGIATLWVILFLPVLLILLCVVIEVANLWMARLELENAMEAAALAAVTEWGTTGATDTSTARNLGVSFAAANSMRGNPVFISPNRTPNGPNNENAACTGNTANLIFGAITNEDPVTFKACAAGGCGGIQLALDASGKFAGNTADGQFGVQFIDGPGDENYIVTQVVIELWAQAGAEGVFETMPVFNCAGGINGASIGVAITPAVDPHTLTLTLPNNGDAVVDAGEFAAGDYFRMDVKLNKVSTGGGTNDGDGVGRDGVTITLKVFDTASQTFLSPDITAVFVDTCSRGTYDPTWPMGCGPTPPQGVVNCNQQEDDQSLAFPLRGGSGLHYCVRAHAVKNVNSLFGIPLGPRMVQAEAFAMYDCADPCPRLLRVNSYSCSPCTYP